MGGFVNGAIAKVVAARQMAAGRKKRSIYANDGSGGFHCIVGHDVAFNDEYPGRAVGDDFAALPITMSYERHYYGQY